MLFSSLNLVYLLNVFGADIKRRTRNEATNSSNENTMYISGLKSLFKYNFYDNNNNKYMDG